MRVLDIVYMYRGMLTEDSKYERPKLSKMKASKLWDLLRRVQELHIQRQFSELVIILGFVQGVLYAAGIATIEEVNHHNQGIGLEEGIQLEKDIFLEIEDEARRKQSGTKESPTGAEEKK